jgi:hypothetical protein
MEIWTSSDVAVKLGGVASLLGRLANTAMQRLWPQHPSARRDHDGHGTRLRLTNGPEFAPAPVPIRNPRRR